MAINFFNADVNYTIKGKLKIKAWLISTAKNEGFIINSLNIILCSDEYLFNLNKEFLNHVTYTDIITFDHGERRNSLEGELYISIERVRENATNLDITVTNELHRVIVHGLLHLCGYKDKSRGNKAIMSGKEDYYLSLRKFL